MSLKSQVERYYTAGGTAAAAAISRAAERVPSIRDRLASADAAPGGLTPAQLDSVTVLGKDELPALQREHPPFGGLVAEDAAIARVFASPGPIYEVQLEGEDPWQWHAALSACGMGSDDLVLNCFGYHLSPAGMMFDLAARGVGATVVPAGVGATDIQARLVADVGPTAYIGLPSYLAALLDRYDELGLPRHQWRIDKALVTAEPLPDDLRARLQERIPTVLMAYGTAEAGLIAYETAPGDGLEVPDHVFVQICVPESGEPILDDTPGEVVVTMIGEGAPLMRFGTGDVSRWQLVDDRLRLAGVLGRVGAAVKARGMFIHPHQAAEVLRELHDEGLVAGRYLVERDGDRDRLLLHVVPAADAVREELVAAAEARTVAALRVRPEVAVVDEIEESPVLVDARDHR